MEITLKWAQSAPKSEFDLEFLQGMLNRMAVSFHVYGAVADAFPDKVNALNSLEDRLREYRKTGNLEYLMDAANFAMIEFMRPSIKNAAFTPTDSSGSCGRAWNDGERSRKKNKASERKVRKV